MVVLRKAANSYGLVLSNDETVRLDENVSVEANVKTQADIKPTKV